MYTILKDGCLWDEVGGRLVMPLWEKPLWQALVGAFVIPGTNVFEVGLGLGISNKLIDDIATTHLIAEKDESTLALCTDANLVANTEIGDGQTILEKQSDDSFDCILLDDYSIDHPSSLAVLPEFWEHAGRVLTIGGRVLAPFCEPGTVSSDRFEFREFGRIQLMAKCEHGTDLNLPLGYWEKIS